MPFTSSPSADGAAQEQVLNEFRDWMLSLSEDRLSMLGVDFSVEEPLRLLRGFATERGITLRSPGT